MAESNDYGISGRNGLIERKIDRWGSEKGLFGSSGWRLGLSGYAQLARFLTLRLSHVTSLPDVPRPGARLQAGSSSGGGKNNHHGQ
jgi:hypothetical protein